MKTQNTKLDFTKNSVIELNDQELTGVAGGGESVGISISFHKITSVVIPLPVLSIMLDL